MLGKLKPHTRNIWPSFLDSRVRRVKLTLVWFPSRNILASVRPLPFSMGGAENASRTKSRPELSLSMAAVVPSSANSFTPSDAGCSWGHFHSSKIETRNTFLQLMFLSISLRVISNQETNFKAVLLRSYVISINEFQFSGKIAKT